MKLMFSSTHSFPASHLDKISLLRLNFAGNISLMYVAAYSWEWR